MGKGVGKGGKAAHLHYKAIKNKIVELNKNSKFTTLNLRACKFAGPHPNN